MGLMETIRGWLGKGHDPDVDDAVADAEVDDEYPAYRAAATDELNAQLLGSGHDAFDADQSAPPR